MAAFIASQRHWLAAERLPAGRAGAEPGGGLWSNLEGKGGELANFHRTGLSVS